MNHDWLNDPRLTGISPEKKTILISFAEGLTPGMTKQQMMANFMQTQKKMKEQNLSLSNDEAALMIQLLKESMSDAEKERLEGLMAKMGKHKK